MSNKKETKVWYVASPIPTYHTPLYTEMRKVIPNIMKKIAGEHKNKLLFAKGMYKDAEVWKQKWPVTIQEQVTGGTVFFTDSEGYIGKGVYTEVEDTLKKGLPVYLVLRNGQYFPITSLAKKHPHLIFTKYRSWKRYIHVEIVRCCECKSSHVDLYTCRSCQLVYCEECAGENAEYEDAGEERTLCCCGGCYTEDHSYLPYEEECYLSDLISRDSA